MVQTLVPSLGTLGGQLGVALAVYAAFVLALVRLTEIGTADPPGTYAPRRRRPVLPSIAIGMLTGIAALQLLPLVFPGAAILDPLREGWLAMRRW